MKFNIILIFIITLIFCQNCEKQPKTKRKIKLAADVLFAKSSKSKAQQTTVLKFDAAEKRSIAVLTFENQTGDQNLTWLCQGITDMLIRDLSQSRFLKVITLQRMLDIFKNLGIQSPGDVDYKIVSSIGKEAQVEAVIKGSFSGEKDSFLINLQLYNVESGKLLQEQSVSGNGLAQIFGMVDELTNIVKTDLRLSFKDEKEQDLNIADISTKSPEAYRYYSEGVDLAYRAYFGDAIKKFQQAIELDSTFAMAHFWESITCHCLDKLEDANKSITKAVKFSNNISSKEKMKISWVYAAYKKETEKSFNLLKELVQEYPDDKELKYQLAGNYYFKQLDKAEQLLQQTLQLDPQYVQVYILQSALFREKGEYESAISSLNNYVKIKKDDASPYHNLGEIYEAKGDFKKAAAYYNKALLVKPDFHFSILSLANIYSTLGEYKKAKEKYLSALKVLPSEELKARVYSGLTHVNMAQGKYKQAIRNINQALKHQGSIEGKANYFIMLAGIYFRKEMFDSTIAITSNVLSTQAQNLPAYNMLGRAFLKIGEVDSAIRIAQKIDGIISDSKYEILRNIHLRVLGKIAAVEGKYSEAVNYFQKILADNLEAVSIYRDLGKLYVDNNEPVKAIESYNKYSKKNPNDALIKYHLALAYEADGNKEKAVKIMEEFMDMWKGADSDIPEIVRAKKYLVSNLF